MCHFVSRMRALKIGNLTHAADKQLSGSEENGDTQGKGIGPKRSKSGDKGQEQYLNKRRALF